jgi:hypothetical protein
MPCGDGGYGGHECPETHAQQLCRLLKIVRHRSPRLFAYVLKHYPAIRKFAQEHARWDVERVMMKKETLARKRAQKSALAKLTPSERKALGL